MKKLTKLVIDRTKWGRGKEGGSLLNPNTKKMCCLGFACKALGYTNAEILNKDMPNDLRVKTGSPLGWLNDNDDPNELATINDSTNVWGKRKETKIAKIFAENGCKVTFIN